MKKYVRCIDNERSGRPPLEIGKRYEVKETIYTHSESKYVTIIRENKRTDIFFKSRFTEISNELNKNTITI